MPQFHEQTFRIASEWMTQGGVAKVALKQYNFQRQSSGKSLMYGRRRKVDEDPKPCAAALTFDSSSQARLLIGKDGKFYPFQGPAEDEAIGLETERLIFGNPYRFGMLSNRMRNPPRLGQVVIELPADRDRNLTSKA
jgi:hypothetical protein